MPDPYAEYYSQLNAPRNADWQSIRKAYQRQVKIWHPDRFNHTEVATAQQKFKEILKAYKTLLSYYKTNGQLPAAPPALFQDCLWDKLDTSQSNEELNTAWERKNTKTAITSQNTPYIANGINAFKPMILIKLWGPIVLFASFLLLVLIILDQYKSLI